MLPKNRRIQKKLFSDIVLKGRRHNSLHFLVYITQTYSKSPSKFSFSVSKKVCKSAVDRNRLRKQGYSVISKHINEVLPGFICFFSFKKGSNNIIFKELETEIGSILNKEGVI